MLVRQQLRLRRELTLALVEGRLAVFEIRGERRGRSLIGGEPGFERRPQLVLARERRRELVP